MSTGLKRNLALTALAGVGALVAVNTFTKPSKTQSIAAGMRRQLDDYNSDVHPNPEQGLSYASPRAHAPDFIFFLDES
jgi:hypothetical protein